MNREVNVLSKAATCMRKKRETESQEEKEHGLKKNAEHTTKRMR